MSIGAAAPPSEQLSLGEARGRWVLAATILGSGMALADSTIVNIALPAIDDDLGAGTTGLTWTVNAYTLTLAALILPAGSLGDRLGRRRVFVWGVVWFALASLACAAAPNVGVLVAARALQGVGGAMLTPGSLAILQATFRPEDRGRAIGAWSGFSGIAVAAGPLLGGWLLELGTWRWVFFVNLPIAAVVILLARHVPESRDPGAGRHVDLTGVVLVAAGLGALTYGLSAASEQGFSALSVIASLVAGALALAAFVAHELRTHEPMLPLGIFSSRIFAATNVVTFVVYAALGAISFWLVVTLQVVADKPPLVAGMSLLPLTIVLLLLSPASGSLSQRTGPRLPMTVGPLLAAAAVALLARIDADTSIVIDVLLPMTVLGLGLAALVTPLTATVLAAVPDNHAGLASGVNNAVARTASLLAVAVLPVVTGIGATGFGDPGELLPAFRIAMWVCTALLVAGAGLAAVFVTVPRKKCHPEEIPAFHCDVCGPPVSSRS